MSGVGRKQISRLSRLGQSCDGWIYSVVCDVSERSLNIDPDGRIVYRDEVNGILR
jgi:hypothetical protein